MSRNDRRRGSRGRNWNNREANDKNEHLERGRNQDTRQSDRRHDNRGNSSYEKRQDRRRSVNQKEIEENQNAIRAFKEQLVTCEICGEPIEDIANAISNRESGLPVHFDCVLKQLTESEKLSPSEKIAYIGQGRFGILYYSVFLDDLGLMYNSMVWSSSVIMEK